MKKFNIFITAQLLMFSNKIFADTGIDAPPPPEQNLMQMGLMVAMAIFFFYFILFRPEQKRRKALEEQRSALKKGDRVTAMGIIGTVYKIQDQTIILKMVDGNKIEFLKGAITDVVPGNEEDAKKIDKDDRQQNKKTEVAGD